MKKLIGIKKTKTAVFISGKGSNLENLIKFSKKKFSPISINLIISNTNYAKGLKYSKKYNTKVTDNNSKLYKILLFNINKYNIYICGKIDGIENNLNLLRGYL